MSITQGLYEHYKSTKKLPRFYQVLLLSHMENSGEVLVHYQPMYYDQTADNSIYNDGITIWTRTLSDFTASVSWQGKTVPRFTRVS